MRFFGKPIGRRNGDRAVRAPTRMNGESTLRDAVPFHARSEGMGASRGGVVPDVCDASEEEERKLQRERSVLILTGEDAVIHLGPKGRGVVALLGPESGARLLVNREEKLHGTVALVRERARELGIAIALTRFVSLGTLQEIYHRDDRATKLEGQVALSGEVSGVAEQFRDLMDKTAALRASDIQIRVGPYASEIIVRIDGDRMKWGQKLTHETGMALLHVAFNATDEQRGSTFDPNAPQLAQITGKHFPLPGGLHSARLQFFQIGSGQSVAIRLLYTDSFGDSTDVDRLGYARFQVEAIRRMRQMPYGMVLISGVVGSGKSTTLQKTLATMYRERRERIHIVTIEDPTEFVIAGTSQMPVTGSDEHREELFARAGEVALRVDPNVIMLGEVRDLATAKLAVHAARTGHSVWATVHSTSVMQTIERLVDIGIKRRRLLDPELIIGFLAQRLVPVVCPNCSMSWEEGVRRNYFDHMVGFVPTMERLFEPSRELLDERVRVVNPDGCREKQCLNGNIGRTVVAETLLTDAGFFRAYGNSRRAAEDYWIDELGGFRMREHGFVKLAMGQVDPLALEHNVVVSRCEPERIEKLVALVEDEGEVVGTRGAFTSGEENNGVFDGAVPIGDLIPSEGRDARNEGGVRS